MAAPKPKYPTLPEIRNLSNQELFDKKLVGVNLPSLAGTVRT